MSDTVNTKSYVQEVHLDERPPPLSTSGPIAWLRIKLFNTWYNSLLTLIVGYVVIDLGIGIVDWALVSASFSDVPPDECRASVSGACWSFVHNWWRFILFGLYPYDDQWRPALFLALAIAMIGFSCWPGSWRKSLAYMWGVALVVMWWLMAGGFGLEPVPTNKWGGLSLTLMLAGVACVFSFPIAILLALGRRSNLPAIKTFCVTLIEVVRGVPLITILFMASFMIPLFLPEGVTLDAVLRAMVGMTLFTGVYLAEVIRGGLQAIPKGQYEAADALGLSYWQKIRFIILPQALKISIPPIVNSFIAVFKDTSLVLIIGLFDMMTATKNAIQDAEWRTFYLEGYLFAALIYFGFCFFMSKYSQWLEERLARATKR
ncbi:MAG: amino acid ABC transporter permease [Alphaproteobacteria bacterium]|nr:amino acid ABC transporter permease [Alphaproteobacteria bacterium SS10]